MHRIHYSGASLLVADEVAHAVLAYAQALAEAGRADTVTVPLLRDAGDAGDASDAEILLGPASQLFAVPAGPDPVDGSTDPIVADLLRRSRNLGLSRPSPQSEPPWGAPVTDDEL